MVIVQHRRVKGELRYKDRGKIIYTIIEGFDGEADYLGLKYEDDEKTYEWDYYFAEDGASALKHIEDVSYEILKAGFVENLNRSGYYLHRGEYQLLKEAIVIFVSHKKYIFDVCIKYGIC